MPLLQIEEKHLDRNSAIVAAYKTGAYSQREIGEHFRLHPSTVGLIVRKAKDSQFGTWPHHDLKRLLTRDLNPSCSLWI